MITNGHERLVWLDFLKGLAILAVVMNHVFDSRAPICPSGLVCELSFFNVSLFVLCGGVSASMSLVKCIESGRKWTKVASRTMSLFGNYTLALFLTVILTQRRFDFGGFLSLWISFPAQFYFVLFFCELLVVAPIVYAILLKCRGKHLQSIGCLICIMLVSFYCMFFTRIPMIYGGGGVCLGGSYLFLFSLGLFFKMNISLSAKKTLISILCLMMIPLAFAALLKVLSGGAQGLVWSLNPPGLLRMGYALCLFIGFYALLKIRWVQSTSIVRVFAWFGRHSLDIFLYHMIVLMVLLKLFPNFSGWLWAACCCLLMLIGGVVIGKGVRRTIVYCRQCY